MVGVLAEKSQMREGRKQTLIYALACYASHCSMEEVAQTWEYVYGDQPALYLFSIVLHCRPPLLNLHHQALKEPLLIL